MWYSLWGWLKGHFPDYRAQGAALQEERQFISPVQSTLVKLYQNKGL
jgi:hypothetical protein